MNELDIVTKALWFANDAPANLRGVYSKLGVHPPGTKYSIRREEWSVRLRPLRAKTSPQKRRVRALETYKLRDWLLAELSRVAMSNSTAVVIKQKKGFKIDFGAVDVAAGEALTKTIHGGEKVPIEAFVVYAAALMADPNRKWRKWLRSCAVCGRVFYAKSTGGARRKMCSERCNAARSAERVRAHRLKQ